MKYMICDGEGTSLADGLTGAAVWRSAQRLANELGKPVYVSDDDENGDCKDEEVFPNNQDD